MKMTSAAPLIIALAAFASTACAQVADQPKANEASPTTTVSTASLGAKQIPTLSVKWACGDCEQNEKVAPLIVSDYESQAAQKGYRVSDAETAEIVITQYRQRTPAMRVMLGVFAGKDKLATKILFRGKEYRADDYSANAFSGMNSLCESIAKMAFSQIAASLGN
jgi:hypothetical protein